MPETPWLLNDSTPTTLAGEFEAPAQAWTEHDWLPMLGYMMAADVGGGSTQPPRTMHLYRMRAA